MKSLAALYSTRVSFFAGRAEVAGIKTAIAAVQFLDDFRAFGRILLFKLVAAGQLMARVAQWTGTASPLVGKDFVCSLGFSSGGETPMRTKYSAMETSSSQESKSITFGKRSRMW